MDEKEQQDQADGTQGDQGGEPTREFDPEEVENDPAQNPPIEELKDIKGG